MVHIDTERYRQRRDNGNGNNGNSRTQSWGGVSLLAFIFTVITQGVFMVWWVRGESARIDANQVAIDSLQAAIYGMNTPLSTRVVKIEGRIEEVYPIVRNTWERSQKLEHEILVLSERQQNMARRLDAMVGVVEKGFRLQGDGRPAEPGRRD